MGETSSISAEQLLIGSMLGMFLLSLSIVIFFVVYQRRLLRQQQLHQRKEADYQQQLLRANFQSQEKERNRIGKDLHDEVGALLTTTKLYFQHLDQANPPERFNEVKNKAFSLLEESMSTVRRVSHDLRPVVLERLGLIEAIANVVDKINESDQVYVSFHHAVSASIDDEYALNWYRIVQELINNTLKHAEASNIRIELVTEKDQLILNYSDDGKGLGAESDTANGLGIQNMRSRLSLMQGELEMKESEPGFQVVLKSKLKP
ncbi:sensor histidine kinase [Roseivirga thermotolerans]|uniref:histidine kinase n=1 Tax=Roseivirga thermotolerans TaxID=1758176 RepID=A0ABQ3I9S2_9BACT|nr:sensor histidine kinase [Roseivirga thermotolerans]GHE67797.1 hypothetical protein GCM10011340_24210 [Roseivirga thermotolerans]